MEWIVTPSVVPTMGSIFLQDAQRQSLLELLPLDKVFDPVLLGELDRPLS